MNIISKNKRSRYRGEKVAKVILSYLKKEDKVLDLGLGYGFIAENLKNQGIDIIGADINDYNQTDIKNHIYRGTLPFKSNQFDVVLLIDTLHHSDDEQLLLSEANRVGKRLIVLEPVYTNSIQHFLMDLHDFLSTFRYNELNRANFKTKKQWLNIFEIKGFIVEYKWMPSVFIYNPETEYIFTLR